jgi:hypothetical protein
MTSPNQKRKRMPKFWELKNGIFGKNRPSRTREGLQRLCLFLGFRYVANFVYTLETQKTAFERKARPQRRWGHAQIFFLFLFWQIEIGFVAKLTVSK